MNSGHEGERRGRGQQELGKALGREATWQSGFLAANFSLDPVANRHAGPALRNEKGWGPLAIGTLEERVVFGAGRPIALDSWRLTLGEGRQLTRKDNEGCAHPAPSAPCSTEVWCVYR